MKLMRGMLVLGLLAAVATPAAAQVRMRMESANPYGTTTGWGVYVGPYRGAMISEPGSPMIDVYCVDFNNGISIGQEWNSNFWGLSGNLSSTRFGAMFGAAAQTMYRQAAWLATQFDATLATKDTDWKNIHAAIWHIFTCPLVPGQPPGTACQPSTATGNPAVASWIGLATNAANYNTVNLAEWSVVTDVRTVNGQGGVQEYLTRNVVPEPETVLLFGTGLLLLGFVAWRRRIG